jgi:uncharacterized membrane protein YfcA
MKHVAATYALVFLAKALAAGGGLGGGGLLVPIFIIVAQASPSAATPLSVCSIAGGAVSNYLVYSRRRRVDGAPLIDYGAAILILTPLLMGTMLGALGDKVLPELAIVLCMFVALTAMFLRTARKGVATWHAQEPLESARAHGAPQADAVAELGDGTELHRHSPAGDAASLLVESTELSRSLPPLYPRRTLAFALAAWAVVFTAALARGGHGAPSVLPGGVPCGGMLYWSLFFTAWACLAGLTAAVRAHVMQTQAEGRDGDREDGHVEGGSDGATEGAEEHVLSGSSDTGSDVMEQAPGGGLDERLLLRRGGAPRLRSRSFGQHTGAVLHPRVPAQQRAWNRRRATLVPLVSFIAGVGAGLLGIGGGMLVGPLLLELGVEPRGVAATGAFVVLVADSSVVAQYAVLGLLPKKHGATLALAAFLGTAVGQSAAEVAIAKTGRTAVVTLIIATVIGVSAVATGVVAARTLARVSDFGEAAGWRPLCPKDSTVHTQS